MFDQVTGGVENAQELVDNVNIAHFILGAYKMCFTYSTIVNYQIKSSAVLLDAYPVTFRQQ